MNPVNWHDLSDDDLRTYLERCGFGGRALERLVECRNEKWAIDWIEERR